MYNSNPCNTVYKQRVFLTFFEHQSKCVVQRNASSGQSSIVSYFVYFVYSQIWTHVVFDQPDCQYRYFISNTTISLRQLNTNFRNKTFNVPPKYTQL